MVDIKHAHLYGSRSDKYEWLLSHDVLSTDWQSLQPQSPFYLFIPQNTDLLGEYEQGWKITDIMPVNSVGIVTARDSLTIHWTEEEAWETVNDFASLDPEVARQKYQLGKDVRDWKVELAQADLIQSDLDKNKIVPILYRPFDIRYTYYTGRSRGFQCMPRGEVMRNILNRLNIGFHICRQISGEDWFHIFATNYITDDSYVSNKTSERGYSFFLYLFSDYSSLNSSSSSNYASGFLSTFNQTLGTVPSPEGIFYYIYAIFHSPTYRSRYAEFLRIDFPRLPLTSDADLFAALGSLGQQLVELHLMRSAKLDTLITTFVSGGGNRTVDPGHPKYADGQVKINKQGDHFAGVPPEVWNFYVGGYQVCHKWLKDRKGRILSDDDVIHYQKIVVALQETIRLMEKIDQGIPSWPIE
jgi:hypothetical protein